MYSNNVLMIDWSYTGPMAQSIALRTGEQGVAGSVRDSASIISEDWW